MVPRGFLNPFEKQGNICSVFDVWGLPQAGQGGKKWRTFFKKNEYLNM